MPVTIPTPPTRTPPTRTPPTLASAAPTVGRPSGPERDLSGLLPDGVEPPTDLPADIFDAALKTYLDQRRLDMRSLAQELGIGRATLYRRAGSRDRLLGAVLWYLTRRNLGRADRKVAHLTGTDRILTHFQIFLHDANGHPSLRRFLNAEPEAALRILTSKRGIVQAGVVAHTTRLLAQERDAGTFDPAMELPTLAYVMVRIAESFLYADVIADGEPDVDQAIEVLRHLLRA